MTDKPKRDLAGDAKAALERVRAYAAEHSDDITGTIDKLGDFIDRQTKGKYADRIDKVQGSAKRGVHKTLRTQPTPEQATTGHEEPTWQQPPSFNQPPGAGSQPTGDAKESVDVAAALAKLRTYAAGQADNLGSLVDTVGDFVDKQTQGRYSEKIDRAQAGAKEQIKKLR